MNKKKLDFILEFLFRFSILVLPFYILINIGFSLPTIQTMMSNLLRDILNMFGFNVIADGTFLALMSGSVIATVEITFDCIGVKSMYTLFALVLATPVKKEKMRFLLFALPFVFLINFIRLLSVVAMSLMINIHMLDTIHLASWYIQIGVIFALWYIWLKEKHIKSGKYSILFR